jgi:hypothetical protein
MLVAFFSIFLLFPTEWSEMAAQGLLESDLEHFGVIFWKLVTECKSEKYDTLPYTFSYNAIDCENVWQISKQDRFSMQFRIHFISQVQLSLSQY